MHKNRNARIYSMQFLFHLQFEEFASLKTDLLDKEKRLNLLEEAFRNYHQTISKDRIPKSSTLHFAQSLVSGTLEYYFELETIVARYLNRGGLKHIPKIDLTILLQSLYEILYISATPKNVVINEAIELAKIFSTKEAPSFINGILDNVVKAVNAG